MWGLRVRFRREHKLVVRKAWRTGSWGDPSCEQCKQFRNEWLKMRYLTVWKERGENKLESTISYIQSGFRRISWKTLPPEHTIQTPLQIIKGQVRHVHDLWSQEIISSVAMPKVSRKNMALFNGRDFARGRIGYHYTVFGSPVLYDIYALHARTRWTYAGVQVLSCGDERFDQREEGTPPGRVAWKFTLLIEQPSSQILNCSPEMHRKGTIPAVKPAFRAWKHKARRKFKVSPGSALVG